MLIGLTADPARISAMDLRTLADWTIRPRLLSVAGVSQVTTIGGELKQYQVFVDPNELARHQIALTDVELAVARVLFVEGPGPRPLEVDRVREHHARVLI